MAAVPARRLLVTGSASGIGAATVRLANERGWSVLGLDRADADVTADLATPQGRAQAAHDVRAATERLDAIVACAGSAEPCATTVAVNFFGVAELLTALQPLLAAGTAPRAAVVGSITGTYRPDPALLEACLGGDPARAVGRAQELVDRGAGLSVYPTSKAALARWVRRNAVTPAFAGAGIALNAAAPGTVQTPMTAAMLADPASRRVVDQAVPMPLSGHAPPEAVGHLLLWLASPENTHVTGQVVYVDGGAEATLRPEELF